MQSFNEVIIFQKGLLLNHIVLLGTWKVSLSSVLVVETIRIGVTMRMLFSANKNNCRSFYRYIRNNKQLEEE